MFVIKCGNLLNANAPIAYLYRGLAPLLVSHDRQLKVKLFGIFDQTRDLQFNLLMEVD